MKILRLVSLALLLTQSALAQSFSEQTKPVTVGFRLFESELSDSFPWIRKGRLFALYGTQPDGEKAAFCVYQPSTGGRRQILSGSISALTDVLSHERAISDTPNPQVVAERIPQLAVWVMGQLTMQILDKEYLRSYRENLKYDGDQKTLDQLVVMCVGPEAFVESNVWKVGFKVVNSRGGVEAWELAGNINPFRIDSFNRKMIASDGSLTLPKTF